MDRNKLLNALDVIKNHDEDGECIDDCSICKYALGVKAIEKVIYDYCDLMEAFERDALLCRLDGSYGNGVYEVKGEVYQNIGEPIISF